MTSFWLSTDFWFDLVKDVLNAECFLALNQTEKEKTLFCWTSPNSCTYQDPKLQWGVTLFHFKWPQAKKVGNLWVRG